ncbi:MAG TPA: fused MFS/spermidine synthase [Solirubrobacterales bacterium]|jgi:hypothetical protein|nr:fused MFS/spermidine synthase [Solirubrobacterales bacterium]
MAKTGSVKKRQETGTRRAPAQGPALPKALPQVAAAGLVFVAAGTVLMLEILAVRLLAPYVGLTLETTTSIIGAALAGIALGAAIGGYLADRTNTRRLVVGLFILGGVLTLLTVPAVRWLGPSASGEGSLAALGITVVALVPAAVALSAVSPAVAHIQLHDLRASGTVVGRLSAWATAGALVGTFGTGFVIVPLLPASTAVLTVGLTLIAVGIAIGTALGMLTPAITAGMLVLAVGFGALTASAGSPCDRETKYHCAIVEAVPGLPGDYQLILDGGSNSLVNLNDPTDLEYRYTNWIADSVDAEFPGNRPLNGVFVGGGGFSLPRWLEATRPGSHSLGLEVDGDLVSLDEEKLGLRTSPDLEVDVGDARITMLEVPSSSADVVVGDAFSGYSIPWHLTTAEWLDEVRRVLKPNGIYALNIIDNDPLELLEAEARTMLDGFRDVRMITEVGGGGRPIKGNAVLLGTDNPMSASVGSSFSNAVVFKRQEVEAFAGTAAALRDDYAPADQLVTVRR